MTNDSTVLAKIEHALRSAKPGLPAQLKMMPYPFPDRRSYAEVKGRAFAAEVDPQAKPGAPSAVDPRAKPGAPAAVEDVCLKAGVMLLLYPRDGSWHLPLILRTNTVMHHKDQIGFPGGQLEPGENFVQAALRETWEELGVAPKRLRVIGELTPLYIQPSNFCIYPVVAAADGPIAFTPHPGEVAQIIEVPLVHMMDPRNVREEKGTIRGELLNIPFYAYKDHKIWGATAMVLAEFLDILFFPRPNKIK
jgi:8-oxo-dGTP pyrophosphatase MutT (NUDIX family)